MKSYHLLKVQLNIILTRIGSHYRQEVWWLYHFIDNHPNRIMLPTRPWPNWYEIHIIHLPLLFHNFYILSQASRPLVFYFYLLAVLAFGKNLSNIFLHAFPPIYLSQVAVHLAETRINGISLSMRFLHDPFGSSSIFGTDKLPWYFNTPSPPCSKVNTLWLWKLSFKSIKMGSWYCFCFTSYTNDDSAPLVTTMPSSMESISLIPKCASLCTSLANSLFSSSKG